MAKKKIRVYFAGPLFTIYERVFNRMMAEKLRERGYEVVLPQDLDITKGEQLDFDAIALTDREEVMKSDIVLANLDGADTDSGTAVEVGLKLGKGQPVVGWRTDFRGSDDRHWNAMFNLCTKAIYVPSFTEDLNQLIDEIDGAIKEIFPQQ